MHLIHRGVQIDLECRLEVSEPSRRETCYPRCKLKHPRAVVLRHLVEALPKPVVEVFMMLRRRSRAVLLPVVEVNLGVAADDEAEVGLIEAGLLQQLEGDDLVEALQELVELLSDLTAQVVFREKRDVFLLVLLVDDDGAPPLLELPVGIEIDEVELLLVQDRAHDLHAALGEHELDPVLEVDRVQRPHVEVVDLVREDELEQRRREGDGDGGVVAPAPVEERHADEPPQRLVEHDRPV
mmetsp:Transcript_39113/g.63646  ORF Transcript_39113/g.63646 Transcript_39113/m.63646 type:complete len:239 (-) Transcript_39113:103-819(-)